MSAPKRIQRTRIKGWCKPEGAVVVSRPSRWGNPFRIGDSVNAWATNSQQHFTVSIRITPMLAVALFRVWVHDDAQIERQICAELAGKDLACWCPLDQPCHADVLLEVANS